jgi:aspartate beta-hydroxylase
MNATTMNAQHTAQAAALALRNGDITRARDLYSALIKAGNANASVLLGFAEVCRATNDHAMRETALDRALELEPRNILALILKGDLLVEHGDARSASSFYRTAVRQAQTVQQLAPEIGREVRRAQEACDRFAADYAEYLQSRLASRGFDPVRSSARFAQSVDVVLGRKRIFVQEPRYYYFPGLPQIQFYARSAFPWLDELEQATDEIAAELRGVLEDPQAFAPYVQGNPKRPRKDEAGMLNNPAWSAHYLWKNGEEVRANAVRCPKTMRALRAAPLAHVPNRSPSVLFSLLRAGAHIPPHNGLVNTRLICHLPLVVPEPCEFRVGNELRRWERGKAWLFDDTIEHEAWNRTNEMRVILLFDVWRPELTAEERALVTELFRAIDDHSGQRPEWEI